MSKFSDWLIDQIATEVPPEIAPCESCRKAQCLQGEWERCEHRLASIERAKLADLASDRAQLHKTTLRSIGPVCCTRSRQRLARFDQSR